MPSPRARSVRLLSTALVAGALPVALLHGCKKEDPAPPPLPSAEAPAAPAPPLELTPEDAGVDADAEAGPKKGTGTFKPAASMGACCAALMQNSKSAPPPTNMYMMQAAGLCQSLAGQGKDKASIVAVIAGALKGAGMPAACR